MVHQYEHKDGLRVILQLPTVEKKLRSVEFIGGELVTDDDTVAADIEATNSFKRGDIQKVVGEIKKASRKFVTVSGGRGADPNKITKE
ncbi:hypothetical protein IMZ68_05705 [Candidatus Bathyarchaeota archaeon]|nr:hypothetical protein [Candidatus Bathyarchaeota archaeon]